MSHLAVYGGAGALGRVLVDYFKARGWAVTNIDLVENKAAQFNALVNANEELQEQAAKLDQSMEATLKGEKLKALFCVAGGWAGGSAASKNFIKNSDLMLKQSVHSSLIAARLAARHLDNNGLLVLTGALAALNPTPGMIGYGISKAAIHHLVQDLAAPNGGLPEGAKVTAICPVTLDTPANRQGMPDADFSSWTPLETVAKQLHGYSTGEIPLTSGKIIEILTKDGKTAFNEI
ncbi:hypothetical protein BDB00DRAFT_853824 [Zychaea mexicana]|uniref:uncharacterized protein n=1 Tax=Zychaea mexicana TaxID=64656 RepID=UPI0022FE155D|nr:uncharacterized protein BDB00DRAFT_853824 [Zychaea mexicana]KAI9484727.1 hypothetical protein BDB00DRAFT_853824 [Zychaea mexicana]